MATELFNGDLSFCSFSVRIDRKRVWLGCEKRRQNDEASGEGWKRVFRGNDFILYVGKSEIDWLALVVG